jgi:hypothetical protein
MIFNKILKIIKWIIIIIILIPFGFLAVNGVMAGLFLLFIGKPIDLVVCHEIHFVEHFLKNQPENKPKIKATVTWNRNGNIVINVDGIITDAAACRASFEELRNATTDYIRGISPKLKNRTAQPFVISAKNRNINIP